MKCGTGATIVLLSGAAPLWLGPAALAGLPAAVLAAGPIGTLVDVMAGKIPEEVLPVVADMTVGVCLRVPAAVAAMLAGTALWGALQPLYGVEWLVIKGIKALERRRRCAI
jgi:hypothetical protein